MQLGAVWKAAFLKHLGLSLFFFFLKKVALFKLMLLWQVFLPTESLCQGRVTDSRALKPPE